MAVSYKLGKRAARKDTRVARFSAVLPHLPAPPANSNWYAAIGNWLMLGNDQYGNCAEAAVFHCLMAESQYAGSALHPTDKEALAFYSAATGFNPADPNTDQGSYILGPGSVMDFWTKTGVTCGGKLNKVGAYMQITQKNPTEWMQAVHLFGGMLIGVQLPENVVSGQDVPAVWDNPTGPVAGGHAVWICGYETFPYGRQYDLISWGQRYRCTENFLTHVIDEAVTLYDDASLNKAGFNGAGVSKTVIQQSMQTLRGED